MAPTLVDSQMLDLFAQEGRTPGRHVSHALHQVMSSLHPDRFPERAEGGVFAPTLRMTLGNALEQALADAWAKAQPDRYIRPGQLEYKDIYGTPDLWDLTNWATVEIKLTWASSKRADDIEDPWFWRYWAQLKSYVYMAGQDTGYLVIGFINGDYKYGTDGGQPTLMMWKDSWTSEELVENWTMVQAYA